MTSVPASLAQEAEVPTEASLIAVGGQVLSTAEVDTLYLQNTVTEATPTGAFGIYNVQLDLTVADISPWGAGSYRNAGEGVACFTFASLPGEELCWRHYRFGIQLWRFDMNGALTGGLTLSPND